MLEQDSSWFASLISPRFYSSCRHKAILPKVWTCQEPLGALSMTKWKDVYGSQTFYCLFVLTPRLVVYRSLYRLEDYKTLLYFTVTWHLKPRCLGIQRLHCYFLRDFICSQLQNTFSSRSFLAAGISLHSWASILWCPHPSSTHMGTLVAGRDFHSVPDDPDEILVKEHFRAKLTCFRAVDSTLRGREAEYIGSSGGQKSKGPCLLFSPHLPEALV